jgi:hypothetical protein
VTNAFVFGPMNYAYQADNVMQQATFDRDSIVNIHFGIPRKDGSKDDIQLLYDNNYIKSPFYNSTNAGGGAAFFDAIGVGAPTYTDSFQMRTPYGTVLPQNYTGGGAAPYFFPLSPAGRAANALIPPDAEDAFVNNQGIGKLQYQRNFGTKAFLRLYGYTYYSDWLQVAPQSAFSTFVPVLPSDYELSNHTRGVSLQFSDQLTDKHLLSFTGSYTTATSLRYNNSGIGYPLSTAAGFLVNGNDPYNGTCYTPTGVPVVGCSFAGTAGRAFGAFTLGQAVNGTVTPATGTCGTGPCQYVLVGGGPSATNNTVKPKFYSASITDNWRPTDRWNVSLGMRFDLFQFVGSDTTDSGARTLFYNAWNATHPQLQVSNPPAQTFTYPEWQPRVGFTYTFNPTTVLRANYGRYAQPPNAAFEQYDFLQPNAPRSLYQVFGFGNFGFTTPGHEVRPEVSNNYDLSIEHAFGGDVAVKLTPFLRKTQNQIQQFYLNQATAFVSGLNVGRQTAQGVELEVDKGDFTRNGFSGKLSFTYTNSFINYNLLPNGTTVLTPINQTIAQYNGFTKAGGGAPCYTQSTGTGSAAVPGVPDPTCAAGSIANPYYNAPLQPLLDPNANYATYSVFPGGISSSYKAYGAPYVATMLLQYKHGPLAVTPALQFAAGTRYGAPLTTPGIDPTLCGPPLSANVSPGDARYNFGAAGGGAYDASNCTAGLVIPNQYTNRFDNIGAFVEPSYLALHLQLAYDVNKRVTLVGNFANLFTSCFGGTKVPFAIGGACGYTVQAGNGAFQPIGNAYNPGNAIQPALAYPYYPVFGSFPNTGFPFNMFFEARIKI